MAPAWCMHNDLWKGSRYADRDKALWTGQVVILARSVRRPGSPSRFSWTQKLASASCGVRCIIHVVSSAVSKEGDKQERQHVLWMTFFQDHTRWWDSAHHKYNTSSRNFWHQASDEALWFENCYNPAWVNAQLAIFDARTNRSAVAGLSPDNASRMLVPGPEIRMTLDFLKKMCQQGRVKGAVDFLQVLVEANYDIDKYLIYFILKECVAKRDLILGGQVHALALKTGFGSDTFLCNHFIRMYAGHGKLREAMDVFRGVALPDSFMWSSIISAYSKQGQAQQALELYQELRATTTKPDKYVFAAALQACAAAGDLQSGKQMHDDVLTWGMDHDMFIRNCLVDMYAKCGSLTDARIVFEGTVEKDVVTWNAMISGYAQQECTSQKALSLHSAMQNGGMVVPDTVTFVCLLQACANVGVSALEKGKQLHSELRERGLESDMVVGGSLVNMYAKCGSLTDARILFDGLEKKNVVTWTAMIGGYAQQEGMGQDALDIYSDMQNNDMSVPNRVTFLCVLQACANMGVSGLEKGRQLHSQIKYQRLESDVDVGGSLVNMYVKCGSLTNARNVFDGLEKKNVLTWTAMISGYAQQESMGQDALSLYSAMHKEGLAAPNIVTFVSLLQACANVGLSALSIGKQLHLELKERGLDSDMVVGGSLVNMYAKCGSLTDAKYLFDSLEKKNVVTWTTMISAYAQREGMCQDALSLYRAMQDEGMETPNAVTFVCLLQACANMGISALDNGRQLHSQIMDQGLESNMDVAGSLVNMYAKCGSLMDARIVFDGLGEKDVVTWTAMIAGYAQQEGMGEEALSLYSDMHSYGVAVPNRVTFVCLLQACANVGVPALEKGKHLHSEIGDRKLEPDMIVGCSLVNMYSKCGSLTDARLVFDGLGDKNVVTWNAMIAGYAQQEGMGNEALHVYSAMQIEGIVPDSVTFVCVLQACTNVGVSALEKGKRLHLQIKERGLESDVDVSSSLVNMYAKCGSLADARIVFDGLKKKDVVTWTAMIAGYAQQGGMDKEALCLYSAMHNEGLATPNAGTYVCLLEACASVGALQQGMQLHLEICEGGLESNVRIGTCLVKLYAQCGRLELSREVLDRLPVKSRETWTALLQGYAEHGEAGLAIQCFEELLEQGIQPDEVTYICLLTACSHAGLVDQGQQYFDTMEERHGVKPDERHCTCMVDLLGRSGQLDRAEQMLRTAGLAGSVVSWTALLSACKSYGDADLGRRCFDHLVNLQPTVATAYVLLGSIYANAGRWEDVERLEILRNAAGARKKAAKACIEVKREVHEFTVGEERSDVAATLRKMSANAKEGGHVAQTQLVLRAVSEQEKENALCGHAEKLALAYGLLNTSVSSPLLVTKNLRMCSDCHSSTKIMSRVEKREIVVRDGHKVHRFENGVCSCQDRP